MSARALLSSPPALLLGATLATLGVAGLVVAATRKPTPSGKKKSTGAPDDDIDLPPSGVWLLDRVYELGTWKGRVYATGMQDLLDRGHYPYVWVLFSPNMTQEHAKQHLEITPLEDHISESFIETWGDAPTLEQARKNVFAEIEQSPGGPNA